MSSFEEMYSTTLGGAIMPVSGSYTMRTVSLAGSGRSAISAVLEMRTAYTRRTAALDCRAKPPASVRRAESV